jgi:hypothetical protein
MFKYVRDNGGPDSRPTKVEFIRLPRPAHHKLNVGSRALARGMGSFRPIITYTKGRGIDSQKVLKGLILTTCNG